jgi:glycosyltransferase involved in cell wall biosynthesis
MKQIIFITSTISNSHCKNRIEQFIQQGYKVHVYSFRRDKETTPENLPYKIQVIGEIVSSNYLKRLTIYFRGIKKVVSLYKKEKNILYYAFGLDLAMFLRLFVQKQQYLYEEADLVQTYHSNKIVTKLLNCIDRKIISDSLHTILTSEGYLQYHFPNGAYPKNVTIVPNKLNPAILNYSAKKSKTDMTHLRFAFVGGARFDSIDHFVEVFIENFPQHEFHFYGPVEPRMNRFAEKYENVFYHGRFQNPDDLAGIYGSIDILLCAYDYRFANVRYAEPNKLYEAIYFEKPIIVSKSTFLSEKVSKLNIGYIIDPFDDNAIKQFVNGLSKESIEEKIDACINIPKKTCIIDEDIDIN